MSASKSDCGHEARRGVLPMRKKALAEVGNMTGTGGGARLRAVHGANMGAGQRKKGRDVSGILEKELGDHRNWNAKTFECAIGGAQAKPNQTRPTTVLQTLRDIENCF